MSDKKRKPQLNIMSDLHNWPVNGEDGQIALAHAEQVNGVLFAIANAVNTTLNLYELYRSIHQSLGLILDVTNFFIAIVDSPKGTIRFPYFVDECDGDFGVITDFDPEYTLTGLVVMQQKALLLHTDELKKREENSGITGTPPLVWLGAPLLIRKQVIGVIAVQSYTNANIYNDDDLQLLSAISHQVAIAIDRKNSLEKLIKSEDRFRQLFEHSNDAIIIHTPSGKIIDCNKRATEMLGYSRREFFGLNGAELFDQLEQTAGVQLYKDIEKYGHLRFESRLIKADTTFIDVELSAKKFDQLEQPVVQTIVKDITEFKTAREEKIALQEKLNRSKKMEALGLLAGSVAHDLNNILSGIISYPELILLKLDDDHELVQPVKAIFEAGKRAAGVVADLLTIARSTANIREFHSIDSLVLDYLNSPECQVLKREFPDVVIHTDFSREHFGISCSSLHVRKSLMNLVTNGVESIQGKGHIFIETDCRLCPDCAQQPGKKCSGTNCVTLSVRDTGPGINENEIEHIFEPFYSGKIMGRSGTGLGLTVVWNTMQEHNGAVYVETSAKGTVFTLYFPVATKKKCTVDKEIDTTRYRGHGESILIVDDEPQLRDIASQMLSTLGYLTHTVASGVEAIEFLEEKSVDLVLLDMLMEPGLNGREVYEQIIKIHPGQKAVIASGYSKSEEVNEAFRLGVGGFVKKPYSFVQLSKVVQDELYKK